MENPGSVDLDITHWTDEFGWHLRVSESKAGVAFQMDADPKPTREEAMYQGIVAHAIHQFFPEMVEHYLQADRECHE